jgi:hypothetical protein
MNQNSELVIRIACVLLPQSTSEGCFASSDIAIDCGLTSTLVLELD